MKSSRGKQTKEDKGSAYPCGVFSIDFTAPVDLSSFILLYSSHYFIMDHGFPQTFLRANNLSSFVLFCSVGYKYIRFQ